MFENLLGQAAAEQLASDFKAGSLPPAMLFSGPVASGKGTASYELGRIISCEAPGTAGEKAAWACPCPACSRHRFLAHGDLLCLGWKSFSGEINASRDCFERETSFSSRMLFIRSVRKLLLRFNPVLWEDDTKGAKYSHLISSLDEDLNELSESNDSADTQNKLPGKLIEGIVKNAFLLESEGLGENIPIAQIKRAASWSYLAPAGNGKLLIIENSDLMQDEARNSLLKLLEEPPGRLNIVLTATRPGSLLPTIVSRLRTYRFIARDFKTEKEIIRRIFKDSETDRPADTGIAQYLDSFLSVSPDTLEKLAAFFAASAAYKAALLIKKRGRPLPQQIVLLGKFSAPKAEAAGLGRPHKDPLQVTSLIVEKACNFGSKVLFSRFLSCLLEQVSKSNEQDAFLPPVSYNEIWKNQCGWAENAVRFYNLRPALVLEKLFTDLTLKIAELFDGEHSVGEH